MGIYTKIFKNKEDDLKEMLDKIFKGADTVSVNYHYVFSGVKTLFFAVTDFDNVTKDEESVKKFLYAATLYLKMNSGLSLPAEYFNLPFKFRHNAIVFEVPNPKKECDCNYVALIQNDDEEQSKCMYTNEFFAGEDTFRLCLSKKNMHSIIGKEPKNLEEFIQATVGGTFEN